MNMKKLIKGDDVVVITGKDKGKRGSIIKVEDSYVFVQGINLAKKHEKPNPINGSVGGIVSKEMPIHISNVAIFNYSTSKPDRVGFILNEKNKKVRIYKSTNEPIKS